MKIDNIHEQSRNTEDTINLLATLCHENSDNHGFWDAFPNIGEKLCLIHSEVSEALEAIRLPEMPQSKKIPAHTLFGEELADAVIRIMDLSVHMNVDLGKAITDKMKYNANRPFKHGKTF